MDITFAPSEEKFFCPLINKFYNEEEENEVSIIMYNKLLEFIKKGYYTKFLRYYTFYKLSLIKPKYSGKGDESEGDKMACYFILIHAVKNIDILKDFITFFCFTKNETYDYVLSNHYLSYALFLILVTENDFKTFKNVLKYYDLYRYLEISSYDIELFKTACYKNPISDKGYLIDYVINRVCKNCTKIFKKMSVCSGCLKARYCGSECQKADWVKHKLICKK